MLLGGIIDERVERIRNGVPFLMDVPVLGRLFRIEQDKRERTELVILITPHVIRDRNEAQVVTTGIHRPGPPAARHDRKRPPIPHPPAARRAARCR